MTKNVVFSTLTTDVRFVKYSEHRTNTVPRALFSVVIKGGANNPIRKTLVTPRGVATVLSDKEMEMLIANKKFQGMVDKGFMSIGSDPSDADRAAAHMEPKDSIAPKTEKTMQETMAAQGARGRDGAPGTISAGAPAASE